MGGPRPSGAGGLRITACLEIVGYRTGGVKILADRVCSEGTEYALVFQKVCWEYIVILLLWLSELGGGGVPKTCDSSYWNVK